jgi:hypothetical protein
LRADAKSGPSGKVAQFAKAASCAAMSKGCPRRAHAKRRYRWTWSRRSESLVGKNEFIQQRLEANQKRGVRPGRPKHLFDQPRQLTDALTRRVRRS